MVEYWAAGQKFDAANWSHRKMFSCMVAMLGRFTAAGTRPVHFTSEGCVCTREEDEKGEYTTKATIGFAAGTCACSLGI